MLILIALAAGVYVYYQIQQEELTQFLTYYHAYNPNFKYEPLIAIDVDALPKTGGNLTVHNLIIAYTFNSADEYDNVPYLRITYVSGPPCNVSQFPSSTNCDQMLLIIPNNNVTNTGSLRQGIYAGPHNSFGFDLQTETGEHIKWHLYLFLMTYVGTGGGGLSLIGFWRCLQVFDLVRD